MKAAPFAYVRPTRIADAVGELVRAQEAGGAKVLAGGQSLLPVLAMRLGRPAVLVDITRIDALDEFAVRDGWLRVGAAVRQRRVERESGGHVPLLGRALPWVGHREIRSRGTVCGSVAHADPSAEMPAVAACLDAVAEIHGPRGRRELPVRDLLRGAMTTALESTEILTALRYPVRRAGEGVGFAEIARRHGDFALAGVALRVRAHDGAVADATLTAFGVSDRPQVRDVTAHVRDVLTEEAAVHPDGDAEAMRRLEARLGEALDDVATDMVTTAGDSSGSTEYRRRLVRVLAGRQTLRAWRTAHEGVAS